MAGTRKFTNQQKEELIERYKGNFEKRIMMLENQRKVLPQQLEMKLAKRSNRVLRKLWDVKMKDILELEREKRLELATLLKDLESLKQQGTITHDTQAN